MTGKLISHANTAHSPKSAFYEQWSRWFVENDVDRILESLDPDVEWEMVGEMHLHGEDAVRDSFFAEAKNHDGNGMREMVIDQIISHGKFVSAWGMMEMEGGDRYRFCDVVEFASNAKDSRIRKVIAFVTAMQE